jgi:hypothetical protein
MIGQQNIGAGNTEIVLSYIYWILTKLVADSKSQTFSKLFGVKAVDQAVLILKKNMEREVDDSNEEEEKYTLSISLVNFLKHCTKPASLASRLTQN